MKYNQKIIMKNGKEAYLRNGIASDGRAVFENFNLTHAETDYLLSYPDENSFDEEQEAQFLEKKRQVSMKQKLLLLWMAKLLELLELVAENERSISLYKKMGFVEYGRNPKGFCSRISGFQEIVYMLLELS